MMDGAINFGVGSTPGGGVMGAPEGFRPGGGGATPAGGGASCSDVLSQSIGEVTRLQQDASRAVEALQLGKTDDMTGVMTAMEKADVAFKTLLAIRSKLMDAYDEVKNISI